MAKSRPDAERMLKTFIQRNKEFKTTMNSLSVEQKSFVKNTLHINDQFLVGKELLGKQYKHAEALSEINETLMEASFDVVRGKHEEIDLSNELLEIEEMKLDALKRLNENSTQAEKDTIQELLTHLKTTEEGLRVVTETSEMHSRMKEVQEEMNQNVSEFNNKWNMIRAQIGAIASDPMLALKAGTVAVVAALGKGVMNMKEFADETGLSYQQVADMGIAAMFLQDESKAILDQWGDINEINTKNLVQMKLLNFQYGVSAETSATLVGQMEALSDLSRDQLMNQIKVNSQLARGAGVSPAVVMEDIASNTEFFAQHAKDGGDNIFRAAIEARKLGLSMDAVASTTESLLDFESSIESQLQASMLLGREINLDRARQLAFTGEQEELMREVKSIVGSEAEFTQMNVIQRKALADAIGLNVEQLSKLVREEETAQGLADKFKLSWVGIGAAIGAIVGLVASLKGVFTGGLSLPKDLATGAAYVAGFGALGAGIGGLASMKVDDVAIPAGGATAITGPAGTFELNPRDSVVAGTDLGGSSGSETNGLLRQLVGINKRLVEQNEALMSKLTRKVGELGVT